MSGIKGKVFFYSNGCDRRRLDSSKLAKYFRLNSYVSTNDIEDADFIIFTTCGFKQSKVDECFDLISEFSKHKGELVLLGCLPGIAPEVLSKKVVGKIIPVNELNKIDTFFPSFKIKFKDVPDANEIPFLENNFARKHTQIEKLALLSVSTGCLGQCSFCAIRFATGKLKSKPLDACLAEYKKILKQGYDSVLLAGEDVGAFGIDIGSSLPELLALLSDVDDFSKIKWKIQTCSPIWAIKYRDSLLEFIKRGYISFLQCDIQSGNKRILNAMKRYSNTQEIVETLLSFKRANKKLRIKTQFIVGFPSETDADFLDSLNTIKKLQLDTFQVFAYSDMKRTKSCELPEKVHPHIIEKRLLAVKNALEKENYAGELDKHRLTLIRVAPTTYQIKKTF